MQKNTITRIIGASLLLAITACQPPSDKPDSSEATSKPAQTEAPASAPSLAEAKTPKALTKAIVALSEEALKDQLICTKLHDTINAINNRSEIEDIHGIQRQLEACLPVANNAEIQQWLKDYQAMYSRFLSFDSPTDSAAFFTVMSHVEQGGKITVAQLKQVNPRVRYLLGLIRSKADIKLRYMGANDFKFYHDLAAMAAIFAPYLPDDQREFIQRMAQDNQKLFWFDGAIELSLEAVVARAIYWEDFMSRYPDSSFYDDAKTVFDTYRHLLFFGANNIQWTDDERRKFYIPAEERLMMQLAKRTDSQLAQDVQKLLAFMQQSDNERQKLYPAPEKDKNDQETNKRKVTQSQLNQALEIPSLSETLKEKNCLNGIICVDNEVQ